MSTIKYERDGTLKAPNEIGLQDESGQGEQRSEPVRPELYSCCCFFDSSEGVQAGEGCLCKKIWECLGVSL